MTWTSEELGWPWVCLGGSLVMFALVLGTNFMRSQPPGGSRWQDPVWLAWLLVPVLMFHMFEEYGHDILGRTYLLAESMCPMLGYPQFPDCPVPRAHFPLINLAVAFVAAPIAASFARRNLMVGLCFYGLVLFNGIGHVASALMTGPKGYAGVASGTLLFIPLALWTGYVVLKTRALPFGALALSYASGIIAHIGLIGVLQLPKAIPIGATGFLLVDCAVAATAPLLAGLFSLFFRSSVSGPGRPASAHSGGL